VVEDDATASCIVAARERCRSSLSPCFESPGFAEPERVDHTLSPESITTIGSELESVVLNRALQWHTERRVFRNGNKTVVLK
jgi:hypothetical protein